MMRLTEDKDGTVVLWKKIIPVLSDGYWMVPAGTEEGANMFLTLEEGNIVVPEIDPGKCIELESIEFKAKKK